MGLVLTFPHTKICQNLLLGADIYILAKDAVYLIDEKNEYIKRRWNIKLKDLLCLNDTIYGVGDSLYYLSETEFFGIMEMPPEYNTVIKVDDYIYGISNHRIYNFINKREIAISKSIMKFINSYERIWVLDEGGLSVYNLNPNSLLYLSEEYRLPLEFEEKECFALSTYGLRLYIAKENRIDVFDTETFSYITTITINEKIRKITSSGDKIYCLTDKKIFVIQNNKLKRKITIPVPAQEYDKKIIISQDYGVIVTEDRFYLFDANKIIGEWGDKLLDFGTHHPIAYFLVEDGLITMNLQNKLTPITHIKINYPKKIIIK